jgi:hypothetical protein
MSKLRSGKAVIRAMLEFYKTHGWTQEVYARDASGDEARYLDSGAVCFCLDGCYLRVIDAGATLPARQIALEILYEFTDGNYVRWNDAPGRTKRQVMAMLRRAAA